jgi:ribosomal protein S13
MAIEIFEFINALKALGIELENITFHTDIHKKYSLPEHELLNERFKAGQNPYDIDIQGQCWHCYYQRSNEVLDYMKNRRKDPETGESKHLLANDLDITKEFDIKRLKKMKSYRGLRHSFGLPVRGQRTRSHFKRKKGAKVGIKKTNDKKA